MSNRASTATLSSQQLKSLQNLADSLAEGRRALFPDIRNFSPPFNASDADLVLRSSQLVDFRVHKLILSLASPFFRVMFSLPPPVDELATPKRDYVDGLQVVRMAESTATLYSLLTAIYPFPTHLPKTFEKTALVLAAAMKFEMKGMLSAIRTAMHAARMHEELPEQAFRRYGIACRYGLEEEALLSAWHTLDQPMDLKSLGAELRYVSGPALYELLQYCQRCVDAATRFIQKSVQQPSQMVLEIFPELLGCRCRVARPKSTASSSLSGAPDWWVNYWQTVKDQLSRPTGRAVVNPFAIEEAIFTHGRSSSCKSCNIGKAPIRQLARWAERSIDFETKKVQP